MATTVPAASNPRMRSSPSCVRLKRRILVSTGLTDAAWFGPASRAGRAQESASSSRPGSTDRRPGGSPGIPLRAWSRSRSASWSPELWPEEHAAQCCDLGDHGCRGEAQREAVVLVDAFTWRVLCLTTAPTPSIGRPTRWPPRAQAAELHRVLPVSVTFVWILCICVGCVLCCVKLLGTRPRGAPSLE